MTLTRTRTLVLAFALLAALVIAVRADAPHVYAITGARLVTSAGAPIDAGTIVIRGGFIDAIGAAVAVPPEAVVTDGKGMIVYPGLIDLGNSAGVVVPALEAPRDARTLMEFERVRRQTLLRANVEAAQYLRSDAPELRRLAGSGITTVLATPPGEVLPGRSSLVNVVAPEEGPQIGNVADERRGLYVVRTPVALHVTFTPGGGREATYPASGLGAIAFVRQALLDAGHYQLELARYERLKASEPRPVFDAALEALQPALAAKIPVVFRAGSAVEIRAALSIAKEFGLDPIIAGAQQGDQAVTELKAQKARVIYSLNYPVRSRALAPGADEPLSVLRARANAPKVPAALEAGGLVYGFSSAGLADPKEFLRNAARAVRAGLAPDAALRALTINAATIAGAADRLGSLERGKIANVLVASGDLFDDRTRIIHVFVDGRPVPLEADRPAAPRPR